MGWNILTHLYLQAENERRIIMETKKNEVKGFIVKNRDLITIGVCAFAGAYFGIMKAAPKIKIQVLLTPND